MRIWIDFGWYRFDNIFLVLLKLIGGNVQIIVVGSARCKIVKKNRRDFRFGRFSVEVEIAHVSYLEHRTKREKKNSLKHFIGYSSMTSQQFITVHRNSLHFIVAINRNSSIKCSFLLIWLHSNWIVCKYLTQSRPNYNIKINTSANVHNKMKTMPVN